jgi:tRNA pseudouridine65 synthase
VPLTILFHDADYVAVHKPANLLVHRSYISTDQVFLLQQLRDQIGRRVYPVHRLDRATSGVLLFGLTPDAARQMARRFEARQVEKTYLALARGWLPDAGRIDHPLRDDAGNNPPQSAVSHYRCLARVELAEAVDRYPTARYCLVQVNPQTGRRQQIRKHFKHISHHLIGDTTHGNGKHNRFFRERFQIHRLMLLSLRLGFMHPYHNTPIQLQTTPEDDWQRLAGHFGWQALLTGVNATDPGACRPIGRTTP